MCLLAAQHPPATHSPLSLTCCCCTQLGYTLPKSLLDAHETPLLFAPAYGSSALRTPFRASIVNIRGSYFDEVRAIFSHLNERGVFPVCLLYEEQTIGDDFATHFIAMGGGVARTPLKDDDGNCLEHTHTHQPKHRLLCCSDHTHAQSCTRRP